MYLSLLFVAALTASAWTSPLSEEEVRRWSMPISSADEAPEPIRRLAALRTAWQLEKEGELERAFDLLAPYTSGKDPLAEVIRFHAARIGLAIGQDVSPNLRELFTGSPGPSVRWGISRQEEAAALLRLADRLAESGNEADARSLRRHAALEYARWAPEVPELSRNDRRRRAANLIRDMDYRGGLAILKSLLTDAPAAEQRDLRRQIGRLIGDKMRDDYVRVAAIFRELAEAPEASPDDLLYYAYAVGKLDAEAAAGVYRQFHERFPGHPARTKAEFMIAWTEFDLERFEEAIVAFDTFLRTYPNSGHRFSVRWYRGLALFRLGRYDAAREDFEYTARYTSATDKGRYWTARALLASERDPEAYAIFQALAAREPFSYYGILARALLPGSERPPMFAPEPRLPTPGLTEEEAEQILTSLPAPTQSRLAEAFAAVQLGHPDLAAALLEYIEANGLGTAHLQRLLRWLQPRLGTVHRHIRTREARQCREALDQDPSAEPVRECWQALYPSPYADLIQTVRGEVPASLFWAIMRQESYFIPNARSHADALGLMQIVPQVGGPAAEALGRTFSPYELCRPATNLALFAHAAKERFDLFGGHVPLVLMSYNATQEKARLWLAENRDLPFDLFVEEIPYGETRDYVKRISSHLARYRTLSLGNDVPLHERAGLPYPTMLVGDAFRDVLDSLRDREVAQIDERP